jgi:hypothetical protein
VKEIKNIVADALSRSPVIHLNHIERFDSVHPRHQLAMDWKLKDDMKRFIETSDDKTIIMVDNEFKCKEMCKHLELIVNSTHILCITTLHV